MLHGFKMEMEWRGVAFADDALPRPAAVQATPRMGPFAIFRLSNNVWNGGFVMFLEGLCRSSRREQEEL